MAKLTLNEGLTGMSGKLGRLIFRQQNGHTVVVPVREVEDAPSRPQKDHRARFRAAQFYAREVLADPLKRACYRKLAAARRCPPNALLVSNFLNPPAIEEVELAAFHGGIGDVIRVLATDAIEVVSVGLAARGADGVVLESGAATKDHDIWVYRCTTALANRAAAIEVTAQNRAGAKGTRVIPIQG